VGVSNISDMKPPQRVRPLWRLFFSLKESNFDLIQAGASLLKRSLKMVIIAIAAFPSEHSMEVGKHHKKVRSLAFLILVMQLVLLLLLDVSPLQSQCMPQVAITGAGSELRWEPLEKDNLFSYASGELEGTITCSILTGETPVGGDYTSGAAVYANDGFENQAIAMVQITGRGQNICNAGLEKPAFAIIYDYPFRILDKEWKEPSYLPSPIPIVMEYKMDVDALHTDYYGNETPYISGSASGYIYVGECGYRQRYLTLMCGWAYSATPLCNISGGGEVDESGLVRFRPSGYAFVISILANINVTGTPEGFSQGQVTVDPYVYVDPSYEYRDQLQIVTLKNPNSTEWVPHRRWGVQNRPIADAGPDQTADKKALVTLDGSGSSDIDGDTLTYNWTQIAGPSVYLNLSDPVHPTFEAPDVPAGGTTLTFQLTVNDGKETSEPDIINIIVKSVNHPPVLNSIGAKTVNEINLLEFTVTASDPDNDLLIISANNLPAGATFDAGTGKFSWVPNYTQSGNYRVQFSVTDNGVPPASKEEIVTITVGNVNRPPVLDPIGNKTIKEGELLEFTLNASDPDDGDALVFSASNLPSGATFDVASKLFRWIPTYDQAGNYTVRFIVSDNGTPQESDTEEMSISVGNVNRPPVLNPIGCRTVVEGQTLTIVLTGSDPDNDALTYSASNLPPGATFDPATQTFTWTPTYDQTGTYPNIEFTVTDGGSPAELDVELIKITVGNPNRAPVFTLVGTQNTLENQLLRFNVKATDPDGDAIIYSTGPLPTGASFTPSTRTFSWTPDNTQAGTYAVIFYATDNGGGVGQLEVLISVGEVPTPCKLVERIIQTVLGLQLKKSVENSYMANMKKVCKFIQDGKIFQAIIQLDAFIAKVLIDIVQHDISAAAGRNLINMAVNLINTIRM
jgi:hypothetical protein